MKSTGKLFISIEHFHHHAFEILDSHSVIRDNLIACLTSEIFIETRIKKTKNIESKAIKADFLNIEIRRLLRDKLVDEVKFEVNEEKGVFYFSSKKSSIGGFDFAILNHKKNLTSLRNLCFGELHYHEGEKRWKEFLHKNKDLTDIASKLENKNNIGININYNASGNDTPLIVGEIQFGNWALAYRDFFKVLKANVQNSIDCLVYIVPTGNLEKMLSDGIVTFDKSVKILNDFAKVISVPVWVIGIDLK
ncbi:BglII/BstYI family type II restriction endonuclease [Candidatus Kapabacteria bacterium]|nr:BglII/BstYI family type II restriction endonuclease [Candidatus Kapabacteria bacterium]